MADSLAFNAIVSTPKSACGGDCGRCTSDPVERWRRAGRKVRSAAEPDEPRLVERYLTLAKGLQDYHGLSAWDISVQCVQLLLETCADARLPQHWRWLCLDYVYRPLDALEPLADSEARQRYLTTLRWHLARLDMDIGTAPEGPG